MNDFKIKPAERTEHIKYAVRDIVVLANKVAKNREGNALSKYWRP